MTIKTTSFQSESGHTLKYFVVYCVRCIKHDGEAVTHNFYSSREAAEKDAAFAREAYASLYRVAFVREEMVWVE